MTEVLMSFCNVAPDLPPLGIIDMDHPRLRYVTLPDFGRPVNGATGICWLGTQIAVVLQHDAGETGLLLIAPQWRSLSYYPLRAVLDGHSAIVIGDELFVVSTGTNSLIRLRFTAQGTIDEGLAWAFDQTGPVHLNSLTTVHNDVLVSCFGVQHTLGWQHTRKGCVINTRTDTIILSPLYHPHSLMPIQSGFLVAESGTGTLWQYHDDLHTAQLHRVAHGYLRGLQANEDRIFASVSRMRRTSRSRGTATSQPDSIMDACLLALTPDMTVVQKIDLPKEVEEIYDLLLL